MPVRYLSDPKVAWLSYWPDHHLPRRALNAMRGEGLKSPTRLRRTSRRPYGKGRMLSTGRVRGLAPR